MMKTYLPGLVFGGFLALAMAVSPLIATSPGAAGLRPPASVLSTAVASADPLSPAFVNPYIEQEALETHPVSPVPQAERAYATLEVEPDTVGQRFPVLRTHFREPAGPASVSEGEDRSRVLREPPG